MAAVFERGDISRKELQRIQRRFQCLHQDRLHRIQDTLPPNHATTLDLIPLLFHINHPTLPGYINTDAPAGIPLYSPSTNTLNAASGIASSFRYDKRAQRSFSIKALFLLGSTGELIRPRDASFRLLVVPQSNMDKSDRKLLMGKCSLIADWAQNMGMDLSVMTLTHGLPCSTDTFYASALWVAGRAPLWWFLPPEMEAEYATYTGELLHKRFIRGGDVIDFGPLIPDSPEPLIEELIGDLEQALTRPWETLPELLQKTDYLRSWPEVNWLALNIKRALYQDNAHFSTLDPDTLRLELLDQHHPTEDEPKLARRAITHTCNPSFLADTTDDDDEQRSQWRAQISLGDPQSLDDISPTVADNERFGAVISKACRIITRFAEQSLKPDNQLNSRLVVLGRRILSMFGQHNGKVPVLAVPARHHDLGSVLLRETRVTPDYCVWLLFVGAPNDHHEHPLYRADSAMELLAWCALNHFLLPHTTIYAENLQHGYPDLRNLGRSLLQSLDTEPAEVAVAALSKPPVPRTTTLYINLLDTPISALSDQGLFLSSAQDDALRYGRQHINLVMGIDRLIQNSWGETRVSRHVGVNGVLETLCDYAAGPSALVTIQCFNDGYGLTIENRLTDLFKQTREAFANPQRGRCDCYFLQAEDRHYTLRCSDPGWQHIEYTEHHTLGEVLTELEIENSAYQRHHIDACSYHDLPLNEVLSIAREGEVHMSYWHRGDEVDIYITGERGGLFVQTLPWHNSYTLIAQFHRFLEASRDHRRLLIGHNVPRIRYFEIIRQRDKFTLESRALDTLAQRLDFFDLRVTLDTDAQGEEILTFNCNGLTFSPNQSDADLFARVVSNICANRRGGDYPIYLTAIDLPRSDTTGAGYSTLEYLQQKRRIEQCLSQTMAAHPAATP